MTNKVQIKTSDYEKASRLLYMLIDADSDVAALINSYIQHNGIVCFFEKLEDFDLDVDTTIKLQAVRDVLFGLGMAGEGRLRGGEVNNE